MYLWFLIWVLAPPAVLLSGLVSVVLVGFRKGRPVGKIVSAATAVTGTALALLCGRAYYLARHSVAQPWDLVSPDGRAREALLNGGLSLAGATAGLTALTLALWLSRRRPVPPTF